MYKVFKKEIKVNKFRLKIPSLFILYSSFVLKQKATLVTPLQWLNPKDTECPFYKALSCIILKVHLLHLIKYLSEMQVTVNVIWCKFLILIKSSKFN